MASSIGKMDIPEDLLCPVCFELPDTEVYQCRDGHLLCSTCYFKLTHCPQCRDPLDRDRPIRSRPIERILEGLQISCSFKSNGCNKRLPKGSAKDHELGCCYDIKKFGEFLSICKNIGYPECQFKFNGASIKEALEHFVEEHGCISTNSESFKMELTSFMENAKVCGNRLQFWTPVIADLKERKCLLLTMAVLNKKDATFGISSFFVRYSVNDKLVGSPIELECKIPSKDGLNETFTSFFQTPLDSDKATNYLPNSAELPLYAPCFSSRCNAEGSLTIGCSIKRHRVEIPLEKKSSDVLVCLAKPIIENSEIIDFEDIHLIDRVAVSFAIKLQKDCARSRSKVLPALKEIFSLTGLSPADFNYLKYFGLILASEYGGVEALQFFIDKGLNINILFKPDNKSPPHVTMLDPKPEIGLEKAKLLVKHGADIHVLTNNNCNLLHAAAQFSNKKAVSYFLKLGLSINAVDNDGDTPLHCAAFNKTFGVKVTQLLLECGANPKIQNVKGQTPLDMAVQEENLKVQELLASHLQNQ